MRLSKRKQFHFLGAVHRIRIDWVGREAKTFLFGHAPNQSLGLIIPCGLCVLGHTVQASFWVSRPFVSDTSPKWIDKKAWDKAAQGLGKGLTTRRYGSVYLVVIVLGVGEVFYAFKGFVSRELELFVVKAWDVWCMKRWSYNGRFYARSWCEVAQDSFVGMKSDLRFCS